MSAGLYTAPELAIPAFNLDIVQITSVSSLVVAANALRLVPLSGV